MSTRRILIVDDEPDIREIVKISLSITKQWTVLAAASGIEGAAVASDYHPDAVLLDVAMPQLDGLRALKLLKKNPKTASIPVILLTATAQLALQVDFVEEGVQGVLTKPFDPGILGEQIEAVLGWHSAK